jgi:hypothetical protein
LDKTNSVVLCLISKLFLRLDKLVVKRLNKNLNFCLSLNHRTTFCPSHKLSKNQNNICPPNIVQMQNLFNTLNFVLCLVLFCPVLIFCRSNKPAMWHVRLTYDAKASNGRNRTDEVKFDILEITLYFYYLVELSVIFERLNIKLVNYSIMG